MSYETDEFLRPVGNLGAWENGVEVSVWLPTDAALARESGNPDKCAVLLVLDANSVFGMKEPVGKAGAPRAQDVVAELMAQGQMPACALVGVEFPNQDEADGLPRRAAILSPQRHGSNFHAWLRGSLFPVIEKELPVLRGAEFRTAVGTGLAALNLFRLALTRHPCIYRYACLSTSFEDISQMPPGKSETLLDLLDGAAPHAGSRLFFDYGSEGLDECYEPYHRELDALLTLHEKRSGAEHFVKQVAGGSHDAGSWRVRLRDALRWLFGDGNAV